MSGTESQPICFESQGRDYCQGVNPWAAELLGQKACAACLAVAFQEQTETIVDLRLQAERDSLTNLYNLRAFNALINERIGAGHRFALIFIDIENFSAVNEREQHVGGNFMLRRTAEFLSNLLREDDIARFGGDEFCIALSGSRQGELTQEAVDLVTDKITKGFHSIPEVRKYNDRYETQHLGLHINSDIWVPGKSKEELFRAADPEKRQKND